MEIILQQPELFERFENIKWLHGELSKKWKCIERGILGPPGTPETIQDRIITWKEDGVCWEPDARHAELVIALLGDGPRGAKVTTPLAKWAMDNLKDAAGTTSSLSEEEAAQYRSVAMHAAYLAQDRPDLQVATRSLAQGLQKPTTSHMLMLKKVARYLRYRPRMAQFFPHQSKLSPFVMWSDTDHAGCVKTRKSVSVGVLMAGRMLHQELFERDNDKVLSHFLLEKANTMLLLAVRAVCSAKSQLQRTGVCKPKTKFSWTPVLESQWVLAED